MMNILIQQKCSTDTESTSAETIFAQNDVIAIYFTIPPSVQCMGFVDTLTDVYLRLKEHGKKFEVLQADCTQIPIIRKRSTKGDALPAVPHWKHLPEGCVPALAQSYRVRRVPCLVILRTSGEVVSLDFCTALEKLKVDAWKRWTGDHVIDRMPLYMLAVDSVD
ncbi:putative nucleoredoxin 3-like [Tropilaelaps mercedesae]|uniref:Putative nucleoredoxin 3-like n=1 Tax=Tropilaelaps mercedesae TaxID=418985 RepID=A0A1V9XUG8_9ACAR|nr:putative nucleoredoxin 3-like [Tropilaelaps mercedesae]